MTPIDKFLRGLLTISVWGVVKLAVIFALGLYLIFALVLIRQVQLMTRTVNGEIDVVIKLLGWVHLGIAIGVMLLAIVVL